MATLKSIQELLDNPQALQAFKNASPEVQTNVLEELNPLFKSGSPEARQQVLEKVIDQSTTIAFRDVPAEIMRNLGPSAVNLAKNIFEVIKNPIETAETLKGIAMGGIAKLVPGSQEGLVFPGSTVPISEQGFDAIVEFAKERFGGFENLKRTISKDPLGFAQDLSAALTIGGPALSAAGLARAGATVSRVAPLVEPIGAAGRGASLLATEGVPRLARSFGATALNPTITTRGFDPIQKLNRADELVDFMINEGKLGINRRSLDVLDIRKNAIKDQIQNVISEGEQAGVRFRTSDIVSGLDDLIAEAESVGIRTKPLLREIKMLQDFKNVTLRESPEFLKPSQVQKLKVILNRDFRANAQSSVIAIQKRANDKLRAVSLEQLKEQFPQLKVLNPESGILIELEAAIGRRIETLQKRPIGTLGLIAGGGGSAATGILTGQMAGSVGAGVVGALAFAGGAILTQRIFTSPAIQLAIARALNRTNSLLAKSGRLNLITSPTFQAGRIARETEGAPVQRPEPAR